MHADPLAWLADHDRLRTAAGLRRELRPRPTDEQVIDLASNDYLGLARDPRVVDGAVAALRTWGAGATGSRLVTGTTALHAELEAQLAEFCGAPAALVFSSGYTANLAVVTALAGADTLVVSDALNHASLIDACRLSRAPIAVAGHNDVGVVGELLAGRHNERALVVTESVSSVDGDLAPLRELHAVCRAHGAVLVVDEAHGLGVRGAGGRGLVAECGLAGEPDVVVTVTLSKALGGQGGAVLGSRAVVAHLVDAARTFIFDTGLAPASVGAALAAVAVLRAEPERAARALAAAAAIAVVVDRPPPPSTVVSVVLGEPDAALAAATRCLRRGVRVGCFRPPSVPKGTSRLRLTARATLTEAELDVVRIALRDVW